ncbi:MAG: CvpA family protein [Betaproteobacteria bacterium]|nr:CvpA family protein [Betaproteobacteria bacterium]
MQWLDMPAVDVAMVIVLLVSAAIGVWRGFIYEAASLLGWVAAYVGAQRFSPWLMAQWSLQGYTPELGRGSAFAALFLVILLVWAVAARLLRRVVHATPLQVPDRLGGAAFGLVRGILILLVVATVVAWTPLKHLEGWQASQGRIWLERLIEGLQPYWPDGLTDQARDQIPEKARDVLTGK